MSKEDIEKAEKEAEAHAEEDKKKREAIDSKNHLENSIYQSEKLLSDNKDKLSDDDQKTLKDALETAKAVLKDENADKDKFDSAVKELNDKLMPIGAKLYQSSSDEKANDKGSDKSDKSDDAVEGEVVDK